MKYAEQISSRIIKFIRLLTIEIRIFYPKIFFKSSSGVLIGAIL